jgi:phosphohistidine phosphatase
VDLILWRHAEAEEGANDLARELTPKGVKQAARVAEWLQQRLPSRFLLIASPAARAQQTAEALGTPKLVKELAPGAAVSAIVKAARWPDHEGTVVVVGHQPDLGQAAAFLVCGAAGGGLSIKKGGLWWLSDRVRGERTQVVVRAAISPDLL